MLRLEKQSGGLALMVIDRPAKRNALDYGFWTELTEMLTELEADPEVSAVILTGAGDVAFSAGGDILSFTELDTIAAITEYEHICFGAFRKLETFAKPIVAAVNGFALAGGCELAFACDVVVAAEKASFGVPEVRIGLSAGYASVRFGASLRDHALRSLTLTGRRVNALEARRLGLVQVVVPDSELMAYCERLAADIAANDGGKLSRAKILVGRERGEGEIEAVIDVLKALHMSEDKFEGANAFAEGREPLFQGR